VPSPRVRERVAAFRANRTDGASALAREAAAILALAAESGDTPASIERLGDRLVRARPSMVPVRYAVGWTLDGLPDDVSEAAARFTHASHDAGAAAVETAAEALRDTRALLTHSLSGTVLEAFEALGGRGRRVVVTEARPLCEGVETARRLARMGYDVELITDAAAATFLPEVDAVLLGADAVLRDGSVVNKAGSRTIALAARAEGVPVYAVADRFKLDPRDPGEHAIEEMAASEVLDRRPRGVRVRNPYFDVTPPSAVHRIASDLGLLTPRGVARRARAQAGLFRG